MSSDPPDAVLPLGNEPSAAPFARSYTIAVLERWLDGRSGHADVIDAAALITTELVSNALRHSTPYNLRLQLRGESVVITVTDTGRQLPVRRASNPYDVSGRGLELVEAFATHLGWGRAAGRKAVWARLDLPPEQDGPGRVGAQRGPARTTEPR
ncbi:ATP-binding protein [Streptomyces spectabilis]|uniref:ATP-binding protein n=1 Tax=Streptomyces spectabilis TaxID=68270 RepID=UPI0034078945